MWNIGQGFREQLRNPNHQTAAKAILLDTFYGEIPNGEFFTPGSDAFQDFIIDGNVDIDRERGTRRTAEITILNATGEFTPDTDPDYDGKFYVNRVVRLFRGVVLAGGTAVYAPIGTFMVDVIDTVVERNMSLVTLTLSDPWKKFNKALVTHTQMYPVGTHFNTIVKQFAAWVGADVPLAPVLDPLTGPERDVNNTTIRSKLTLERGQNRGEILKDLATQFGVDLYFDVEGRLVSNDRKDPKDAQEVWHFYSSAGEASHPGPENDPRWQGHYVASGGAGGMLVSVRRTLSDDNLYNHVFVIGTGNPKTPVIYEKVNIDNSTVTSQDRIGDRVYILEKETYKTQAQVNAAGKALWDKKFNLFEDITIDTICNPALEADDVIRITEPQSKVSSLYRISQVNIPLTTSKQTIHVSRNIYP